MEEKLLTPKEVSEILGVARSSIWRYIRQGKLKAIKFSKRNYRIKRREVEKFQKKGIEN